MRHCHQILRLINSFVGIWLLAQCCSITKAAAAVAEPLPIRIANGAYFQALATRGVVFYRLPFHVNWQQLKRGQRLPVGTLLQLSDGATVELNYRHRNKGSLKAQETYIKLKLASTLLLDEQILRKVNADRYFFNQARSKEIKISPEQTAALPLDFQRAWQRVITYLRDQENALLSFSLRGADNFQLALRQKKISLLTPADGDNQLKINFPTQISISWVNPLDTPQQFKIYITKYSDQESTPVAIVRGEDYAASIASPGSYLIRIASLDDRYSSFPHMVHLLPEIEDIFVAKELDKREHKLLYPPDNYIFQTEDSQAAVTFSGRLSLLKKKSKITLHIRPENHEQDQPEQELVYRINSEFTHTVSLAENSYQWWIEYDSLAEKSENDLGIASTIPDHISSERRTFRVLGGSNSKPSLLAILAGFLMQADANKEPLTIYLADP